MNEESIPEGVPGEDEFDPIGATPHSVPPNHAGAMKIETGMDEKNCLIILGIITPDGDHVRMGLPVAGALRLIENLLGKCNQLLMGPPPPGHGPDSDPNPDGESGIILPGQYR